MNIFYVMANTPHIIKGNSKEGWKELNVLTKALSVVSLGGALSAGLMLLFGLA